MIYYSCLTCPPHSSMDHQDHGHGHGPCLFPDCTCRKMEPGAEFVKAPYVRVSKDEARKKAEERGEREPE